jgi:hypothetical protein
MLSEREAVTEDKMKAKGLEKRKKKRRREACILRNALFTPAFSWKEQQSHPKVENGKYNPAIYAGKGEKVPLRQSKPSCGFSWAVALIQTTVGGSMF